MLLNEPATRKEADSPLLQSSPGGQRAGVYEDQWQVRKHAQSRQSWAEGRTAAYLEQNKHEGIELIPHLKGLDQPGLSALSLPIQDPELCLRLPGAPTHSLSPQDSELPIFLEPLALWEASYMPGELVQALWRHHDCISRSGCELRFLTRTTAPGVQN